MGKGPPESWTCLTSAEACVHKTLPRGEGSLPRSPHVERRTQGEHTEGSRALAGHRALSASSYLGVHHLICEGALRTRLNAPGKEPRPNPFRPRRNRSHLGNLTWCPGVCPGDSSLNKCEGSTP